MRLLMRFLLLAAVVFIAGCGETTAPTAETSELPPELVQKTPVKKKPASKQVEQKPESNEQAAEFAPPYPDRNDPFQPPNFKSLVSENTKQDAGPVVLKGFVNLNGPRVLLAIAGDVVPLGIGENIGGVEVLEITPPTVLLQRGRIRWTEELVQ